MSIAKSKAKSEDQLSNPENASNLKNLQKLGNLGNG